MSLHLTRAQDPTLVVEWSEQLRSVTSAWLGAVRRSVRIRLCTSGFKSEKIFGNISLPHDLLLSKIFSDGGPSSSIFEAKIFRDS